MIQNEYNQAFQTSSLEFQIKLNAMLLTQNSCFQIMNDGCA